MLNATVSIAPVPGPSTASAAPGAAEAGEPGFAQALDRAATRPHDGAAGDGGGTDAPEPPGRDADEAVRDPAVRRHADAKQPGMRSEHGGAAAANGARVAGVGMATTSAAVGAASTAATDAAADASPEADEHGSSVDASERCSDKDPASRPDAAEPSAQDLAAWLSTLPLPPARAGGAAANGAEEPERRGAAARVETDAPRHGALGTGSDNSEATAAAGDRDRAAAAGLQAAAQSMLRPSSGAAVGHDREPVDAASVGAATATAASARDEAPRRGAAPEPGSALATLLAAPPHAQAHGTEASPAFQAELQAAVGSEDFAPALGSQLSVMVRDGIEHAQLKLNPAELGPIEVRIDVDGDRAQVDFSATQALTRQALQDAVPALASALREAGLTLTGGGVFEQPREQRGEPRQDAAGRVQDVRGEPSESGGAAAALPRATRTRGVVDLYA